MRTEILRFPPLRYNDFKFMRTTWILFLTFFGTSTGFSQTPLKEFHGDFRGRARYTANGTTSTGNSQMRFNVSPSGEIGSLRVKAVVSNGISTSSLRPRFYFINDFFIALGVVSGHTAIGPMSASRTSIRGGASVNTEFITIEALLRKSRNRSILTFTYKKRVGSTVTERSKFVGINRSRFRDQRGGS